ncbi:MAG: ABC transporter substrate-binding protein [Ignavibacteria bacterium]|nr:ABC transporter substrate-binding protein [Ignavibacteria bacterium]
MKIKNFIKPFRIYLIILSVIFSISSISAQEINYKEQFEKAFHYFQEKKFASAIRNFEPLIEKLNPFYESALCLSALSEYYLNNYSEAIRIIDKFVLEFPDSPYEGELILTKLLSLVSMKNFNDAFLSICELKLNSLSETKIEKLRVLIGEVLAKINFAAAEKILSERLNKGLNENLELLITESLFKKAIVEKNQKKISEYYKKILSKNNKSSIDYKIGILFPLNTSDYQLEAPEEILEGVKFIVNQFNSTHSQQIGLVIADTKNDNHLTQELLKEFAADPQILCCIGPLFSETIKLVLQDIGIYGLPIISPTATSVGLTDDNGYLFQINPNYEMRGEALADYSVNKLGIQRFAVLLPRSGFGKEIGKSFLNKVKTLRRKVVIDEYYDVNGSGLEKAIMNIRKKAIESDLVIKFDDKLSTIVENKLIKLGLSKYLIDSLKKNNESISVFKLFGKYGDKICESNSIKVYKRNFDDVNNLQTDVNSIDALYISLPSKNLITTICSLITKYNIKTQLLGSDSWYAEDELKKCTSIVDGLIFTSDNFIDEGSNKFKSLAKDFRKLTNLNLTRNVFYGIETMTKILNVIENDKVDRNTFIQSLLNDKTKNGISTQVVFGKNHVNICLNILQYSDRAIKKIDEQFVTDD